MPSKLSLFIWYFLKNHKISLLFFALVLLVLSIEISLAPYLLKIIIDRTTQISSHPETLLSAIFMPALWYVLLTIIHNIGTRTYDYTCLKLFPKLRTEICVALFNHLSQHSVSFFQKNFSGELGNKITNITESTEAIIRIINQDVLSNIVTICIATILLATVRWYFSVILLIWALVYIGNGFRMAKKTVQYAHVFSDTASKLNGQLVDSISNIISTKIFTNIPYETTRVDNFVNDLAKKDIILQKHILRTHMFQNLIYTCLILFLIIGLIYGRLHQWVTIGDFAFVLGLSITIAGMINSLTRVMPVLSNQIGKCQQALNIIVTPHEIQDDPNAKTLVVNQGLIEFKHVYFAYDKKDLFKNFNITIHAKQKIGLVGFSGGGKTSFINLILRLFEAQNGEICIDHQNIKSVSKDSLIKNIALIPQHPDLFNRSILDNIRYGNVDAADEEVYAAAKIAKCHDFIIQLREGYNAIVGERGIKLSGGQRQRIAIARAVLKDSPILILDEATSALDSVTENQIQETLKEVMKNKTVIVIAHRLSTIMAMDRILFFKDGVIVEDGTITELQIINGYFQQFLSLQVEGFLP